jgi:glutathione reductase (NADPH)
LLVIGAGSGGLAAAKRAAGHGAKVILIEEDLVGGTCVIRGCIPKKLMVYASHFAHLYEDAVGYGWQKVEARFDWQTLVSAVDREIRRLSALHVGLLENMGIRLVYGHAGFIDPRTVEVDGRKFTATKILIAVGSEAVLPPTPGIEYVATSRRMFKLPEQPDRLAVIGGGYIGVEFACLMNSLGSQVTQILRGDAILRGFDEDIRLHLQQSMANHGIAFCPDTEVEKIEKTAAGLSLSLAGARSSGLTVDAGVLFAVGRAPNIGGLGLDNAGVEIVKGALAVDERARTNQPHIYAVGDCTNRVMLTPVAIAEGRAFADREFANLPTRVNYNTIPTAVFSQPEVGTVGLSEAEAKRQLGEASVTVYRARFRSLYYNLAGRDERTWIKLVVDRQSDRVVGVHMVGKDAAEIIQSVAIAVTMGATKRDFDATMALHPTTAEEFVTLMSSS